MYAAAFFCITHILRTGSCHTFYRVLSLCLESQNLFTQLAVKAHVLIQRLVKDQNVKTVVKNLRSVESKLRNLAAHQIISITDLTIKFQTGYTGKQIMDMLKKAFAFAGIGIEKTCWDSYDEMNKVIIHQMDEEYE